MIMKPFRYSIGFNFKKLFAELPSDDFALENFFKSIHKNSYYVLGYTLDAKQSIYTQIFLQLIEKKIN